MDNNLYTFTALKPDDISKNKGYKLLYVLLFVVSLIILVISIINGSKLNIFIFSMFTLSNGIRLFSSPNKKPVTIEISELGLTLHNVTTTEYIAWNNVKLAKYDGRYFDLFWGSSFNLCIDLQMFPNQDQLEILEITRKYLAGRNIVIAEKYLQAKVVA